jgi:integrase/recombinase XerD
MKMSKAVEGFFLYGQSGAYSSATITYQKYYLPRICAFLHDPEIEKITLEDLQRYMVWLKTDYVPRRFNTNDKRPLSGSAMANHWKCIRGFFRWANTSLNLPRPDLNLVKPKCNDMNIVRPFTREEVDLLMKATETSSKVETRNGRNYFIRNPHALRSKVMILILLDTGMRVGEFVRLTYGDINVELGEIYVRPFESGLKSRPRTLRIGKVTQTEIWKWWAKERAENYADQLIFGGITRMTVQNHLRRIGVKAGVKNVHPHRFRYTFAIEFLRNGGDIFTLKELLGHSDWKMVNHYLTIAQSDTEVAHRKASPVDHWLSKRK